MRRVCICGGGSLGHVIAGWSAAKGKAQVSVFTSRPAEWSSDIVVDTPEGDILRGHLEKVSDEPGEVVSTADVVLLCYPGYLIESALRRLKPFLREDAFVGCVFSSTGFFFVAREVLEPDQPLWGFQRVPFIARVGEYGHSAHLLGYKNELGVAVENVPLAEKLDFVDFLSDWFERKVNLLNNYYEASLSNSNPILHTSRLYDMFSGGKVYEKMVYFYREWTESSAELMIRMDEEFFRLLDTLPVRRGFLPTILDYYESKDAASLAAKLRSIPAFQNITSPMVQGPSGWVPDYSSRYFSEDFPYGLKLICTLAHEKEVPVPTLDRVLEWGMSRIQTLS